MGKMIPSDSSQELKDTYAAWLKQIDDDNPAKLLKSLHKHGRKKSKKAKKQQFLHALQPTQASSQKQIAVIEREESKLPKLVTRPTAASIEESKERRHQALANEANYIAFRYQTPFRPGLAFFELLMNYLIRGNSHQIKHSTTDFPKTNNQQQITKYSLPGFPICVPPTLIRFMRNDGIQAALFYTQECADAISNGSDDSQILHMQHYSSQHQWGDAERSAVMRILTNSTHEVKAVLKQEENVDCRSNASTLLMSQEEIETALERFWTPISDVNQQEIYKSRYCAIQKYIPCKGASIGSAQGNYRAWIVRSAYRKKDTSSVVWILTDSEDSLMTNSSNESCHIVKSIGVQSWKDARLIASTMAHTLEGLLKVSFSEFVVDILQGNDGRWWLLQVKAFEVRSQQRPNSAASCSSSSCSSVYRVNSAPNRLETITSSASSSSHLIRKKWRCAGRYCSLCPSDSSTLDNNNEERGRQPESDPSGYLTKKVIISCEFYESFVSRQDMSLASGFSNFTSALSFHLQHRLAQREKNQLYEPQPLCSTCVRHYHYLREQWAEAVPTTSTTIKSTLRTKKPTASMSIAQLPPRQLPSLASSPSATSTIAIASSSDPVITSKYQSYKTQPEAVNKEIKYVLPDEPARPLYLDEMASIERMLEEQKTHSQIVSTSRQGLSMEYVQNQKINREVFETESSLKLNYSSLFECSDGTDRIEEMWQSIVMKPLTLPIPSSKAEHGDRQKPQYNSFSVTKALEKLVEDGDPTASPVLSSETSTKSMAIPHKLTEHTISIHDPQQVFVDEAYRDKIVREAANVISSGQRTVRLVVLPLTITHEVEPDEENEKKSRQLGEMALRSLFLDLRQIIEDIAPASLGISWSTQPQIVHDAIGCTSMIVPT